jgi:hypothetical protein
MRTFEFISGITKTICVSDNALPGIENAAEHSGAIRVEATCPCLDVWDGAPYPEGTVVSETSSLYPLPATLPEGTGCYIIVASGSPPQQQSLTEIAVFAPVEDGVVYEHEFRARTADDGDSYRDGTYMVDGSHEPTATLVSYPGGIFTDRNKSPEGWYSSSMMDACRAELESRGCEFE